MTRSLFSPSEGDPEPKPAGDTKIRMTVLITVKAAPNPSERYGETVCVAGIRTDLSHPGFVRLYPINVRHLPDNDTFRKYQTVTLNVVPARSDQRRESFRPIFPLLSRGEVLKAWKPRRTWLDDYVEDSMCKLNADVRDHPDAKSLALVRPREVTDLVIERHPGWGPGELRKIQNYVQQSDLFDVGQKQRLEAPRFQAYYRYRCHTARCNGHRQGLLDWEFVALQLRLRDQSDETARALLRERFLGMMCDPKRDVAFFVGNQAKHVGTFSVLGVYYPER